MARAQTPELSRAERALLVRQTLLIPVACKVFENLGVGATLWIEGYWAPIHEEPSVIAAELEHDAFTSRVEYNKRCLTEARHTQASVLGEHSGFCDLFVPIVVDDDVKAFVITGPFRKKRPTAAEILGRWRELTGRQGHPADPEFSRYLELWLGALVLDPPHFKQFQRTTERLASLLSVSGRTQNIRTEALAFSNKIMSPRRVELLWSIASAMTDERSSRVWAGRHHRRQRMELGLSGVPDHVALGLFVSRDPTLDPVDALILRHELQRACADLCLEQGDLLSGRVGDHGVTLLAAPKKTPERTQSGLAQMTQRISQLARRDYRLDVHWGISCARLPLYEQYQVALAAAETALGRGESLVSSKEGSSARASFGELGREFAKLAEEKPALLPARFERFLETVAARSGYRREGAQVQLEASFEALAEAFAASGAIEPKAFSTMRNVLRSSVDEARTVQDLFAVYRRVIQDVVQAMQTPTQARHERGLQRAESYMRRHYAEGITMRQVARVAGFAPSYFSRLFHQQQGVTFVNYLKRLRVERAKELLGNSKLSLQRVAELAGLSTRHYLNRVFREATGTTPTAYRTKEIKRPDRV